MPRLRRRTLVTTKVEFGTVTAARCSVCYRPFEVKVGASEALSEAYERLLNEFEKHVCDEDISQAAFRVVREATKDR